MMFLAVAAVCLGLILLPFLPGLREIRKPKDDEPLRIDMNRTKDPRYFGRSFRALLKEAREGREREYGIGPLTLSRLEEAETAPSLSVAAGAKVARLLIIDGNFTAGAGSSFEKEIYAGGKSVVGEKAAFRALAGDGEVTLGREVKVLRWVDALGDLDAGSGCDLGLSATGERGLTLGPGCRFRRLYGHPVRTATPDASQKSTLAAKGSPGPELGDTAWIVDPTRMIIPRAADVSETLIVKTRLVVNARAVLRGDVKGYRDIALGEEVTVLGNIFAEGDIEVGPLARVVGNVFSQSRVRLGEGARIGGPGAEKSVVGKKGIALGRGVEVYGSLSTEGDGTVS
jgi:predicted acyltransferase (DUF342 family)